MFLLMLSDSNQGYLSSGVGLFVSSDHSVHVVTHGISVGCIGFHMLVVFDLVWQVSFCHGDTGLLGNVLSYLFVLGP